jgi:hypothetical protein
MIIDPREPLAVAVVEAIHAGDQERLAAHPGSEAGHRLAVATRRAAGP